jgi:hypothetical protein
VPNDNFRRELGHVFDEIAGSPSAALPDRVRSSLTQTLERRGPFWIAGIAAALIAAVVVSLLVVANLNRHQTSLVPGTLPRASPSASPTSPTASPSASPTSPTASPSASPTSDSSLPPFVCTSSTGFVSMPTTPASPPVAFVDLVRTGTHTGYDRITIEFNNGIPGQVEVTPQNSATFTQGASGQSITLAGSVGMLITIRGADEHTSYSGPTDFKTGYAGLVEARQMQDFEGTVQWGLGLSKSSCYRAFFLTSPARLVVDIQAG